ncbi:MAG: tRNA-dihydrouridine synthase [Parcubacteria group bacterium Gr01-1014_73]|nr:MAG: tRNA-dihydrouridine synthase [Parcubacteria group bacterium Gr01-1014_73]
MGYSSKMNFGFWGKLKKRGKPLICQAPMVDVTDAAFRRLIAKYGKPDVMWTEFTSADGLCSAGKNKLLHLLKFSEKERPIVAQLFGAKPETMRRAAALVAELGFDGIDINMGCPDRTVEKQGGGAALIKNPLLARELIRAAKEGAGKLPVSVKTRIGYNKNELNSWLSELLAEEPAAIIIHARTRKEMSNVPARWEHIREAVAIRDKLGSQTLIIGNGDVIDLADAERKVKESGADGAMLSRAFFGKPDLLTEKPQESRLEILLEHAKLFDKLLSKHKSFAVMKKHFKAYVSGFSGAKELRVKLMATKNAAEVEKIVSDFLNHSV